MAVFPIRLQSVMALFSSSVAMISFFCILSAILPTSVTAYRYRALRFSGGGIYFWWQAGVSQYLIEKFDKEGVDFPLMLGSSAGSLTATLLANKCDFYAAAKYAIMQAEREKIFDSPKGLAGVWGPIVKEWLEELLPGEMSPCVLNSIYLGVTPCNVFRSGFKTEILSNFRDKKDLIDACMASVHVPIFMDGRPSIKYRDRSFVDGSLYPFLEATVPAGDSIFKDASDAWESIVPSKECYLVDWQDDKEFVANNAASTFLSLVTPAGLYQMMDAGKSYIANEFNQGRLSLANFKPSTRTTQIDTNKEKF